MIGTESTSFFGFKSCSRCSRGRIFFGLCAALFVLHFSTTTLLSYNAEESISRIRNFRAIRHSNSRESNFYPVLGKDSPCSALNLTSVMILVRGGTVFTPENIGKMDILIAGEKILRFFPPNHPEADFLAESSLAVVLNASGCAVTPGLVDIHIHLTGGGGEAGLASRVPEATLSQLLRGGLTTVVGVLGMDSITRSPNVLLAKVTALNRGPVTAFMWTGAYSVLPAVPTVTGSIQGDLALLAPCVGVKVAIADHRASQAGPDVFRAIAAQAQVGGMLGGKAGLVHWHVGADPQALAPLWDIVRHTATPPGQLLPTHMGRTDALVQEGIAWARQPGGAVDLTANRRAPAALQAYLAAGVPPDRLSVSSDAFGSLPKFDERKRLVGYSYAKPDRLLGFLRAMLAERGWDLARALPLVTSRPARRVGLEGKGVLAAAGHADLLVLDLPSLDPRFVVGRGRLALARGQVGGVARACVDADLFE